MKVVAVRSSSNLDGLIFSLAQTLLKGVKVEGGKIELIHLYRLDIDAWKRKA